MNKKKNFITAIICQIITIIYGLIVPRLVLITFGSKVNGLISSITQFLNFISLLEGGLGAVILSELYKPIAEDDIEQVSRVLNASKKMFRILGLIYVVFTVCLAFIYPIFFIEDFGYDYVCTLILILSLGTMAQYIFSITNRLFLQAEQKVYIVNIVSSISLLINIVIAVMCIVFFPEIHVLKLGTSICFFIQPIIYSRLIQNKYKINSAKESYKLKNRWNGFWQNLAHFINMNTDVIVLTIFLGLTSVSVYSTYVLAISALRNLIAAVNDSFQSVYGKYYVEDTEKLSYSFSKFSKLNIVISLSSFMTCLLLINQFVSIYTSGVTDVNYYEPLFALIIVLANFIYSLREPFRLLILAAGKFKETNFGSLLEAIINIIVSLLLVNIIGLVGIAIGTLVAIIFRFGYFIYFIKKDILFYPYKKYLVSIIKISICVFTNIIIYELGIIKIDSIWLFVLFGAIIFIIEFGVSYLLILGPKNILKSIRE